MKKNITFAAVGFSASTLSPVFAQSNVTLYGILDTGIGNIGGSSSTQLRSGSLYASRFGFRGSEDLGGGLKAIFNLEANISSDTGATATPFLQSPIVGRTSFRQFRRNYTRSRAAYT
jgi:predicted porin